MGCDQPRTIGEIRADLEVYADYLNTVQPAPTMTDLMVYCDLVQELADADPEFAAEMWKDAE